MTSSRATSNAKLVKRHQRQQSNALARSSANKFTLRQSQFERQREEEQVRAQQQADAPWSTSRAVGDGLLSRGGHERGAGGYTASEMEVRDTPNPFARGRSAPASETFATTTRSATMGLEKMQARTTRTTRRIDRFNLTTSADSEAAPSPSSLMGVRRVREGEGREEGGLAAPPAKVMRAERFREMISNSKGQRAQLQRERAERDATTVQLDAEINDLLHLLPRRNKVKEEQEAFAQSGTPEVRALLDSYRRNHQAKCLTLKSSGAFEVRTLVEAARSTTTRSAPSAQTAGPTAPSFLDAADRVLLARVRAGAARSSEEDINEAASPAGARVGAPSITRQAAADIAEARAMASPGGGGRLASCDDFDLMMHTFRMDPRRAHAVDRTLTEEEEVAMSVQQTLLKEDREQVPSLHLQERDQTQLTRGEWVAQGGDIAFHMDDDAENAGADDDNVDIPSSYEGDSDAGVDGDEAAVVAESELDEDEEDATVERVGGSATLDRLFEQLERVATPETENATSRPRRLHTLLVQLHRYAAHHVVEVTKAFRLVLVEAERSFLRGTRRGGMRRSLLVYLYAISKIFPTSDYRHAVMTPFLLFLCSALMQMKLDSLEAVHSYLVLATLLLHCLKAGSGRFCAEVVVAPLNVLALQLPRVALEPARYQGTVLPMPLLERTEQALLVSSASAATLSESDDATSQRPPYQVGLFDTTHSPERLLLCAYRLLEEVFDLHRSIPAFPVMCARPFLALDALLLRPPSSSAASAWTPSAAVRLAHEVLTVKVGDMAKHVEAHRTPLAMRTFRPRPLRQFDPLLAEREENAVKNEVRLLKRDIREDKKRLIRHLTAEATVQRRAQEKRHAIDDALREKRYHNVMSQLQQQQHSMNVVDSLKARAKSKSRKGLSGAPTTSSSTEADKE
ncbi:UTP2 [Leishmania donovani]|uniref:Nop14-like_family_putative/Pfam:PF04147 n=1 Tax=Leishmania donovani TaxID=5661 RepID=A0A6J8F4Z1_LEIDO|nr:UTP2 [Leishmania donovani]VDZ41641.1 Nop14-like_family_putative/Pfam:PF04147 [Leishmania donovani]